MAKAKKQEPVSGTNNDRGAQVEGNVNVQRDFIGRDQINILQQEIHFSEIEQLLDKNPAQALRSYLALSKHLERYNGPLHEAQGHNQDYLASRLDDLRESLDFYIPTIIFEIGETISESSSTESQAKAFILLTMVEEFYRLGPNKGGKATNSRKLLDSLRVIRSMCTSQKTQKTNPDKLITAISTLCEYFDLDARPLLRYVVKLNLDSFSDLKEKLIRNGDIRKFLSMPELLSTAEYKWHSPVPQQELEPGIIKWQRDIEAENYPFMACHPENDPLILSVPNNPKYWEIISNPRYSIRVLSNQSDDLIILRTFLQIEWSGRTFSVPLDLLSNDIFLTQVEVWQRLASALAEQWIRFLAYNPQGLLDLRSEDRMGISTLINWYCPDSEMLKLMLIQTKPDKNYIYKHLGTVRRIKLFLHNMIASDVFIKKRIGWLMTLHPTGAQQTVFIIFLNGIWAKETYDYLQSIVDNIHTLSKKLVTVKILTQDSNVFPDINCYRLYWETEVLRNHINARISRTTKNYTELNELFNQVLFIADADQRIAKLADGSLARLLRLGHRLVEHHVQNNSNDHRLTLIDLEWLESRCAGSDSSHSRSINVSLWSLELF